MAGEPLISRNSLGIVVVDELGAGGASDRAAAFCETGLALARAAQIPFLDLRSDPPHVFVADEKTMTRIDALKRRSLLICGGLLEGAVTQIALNTLLDGFDVFIPIDLVQSAEPERESLFLLRICRCHGNILTFRQAVRELLSKEREDYLRKPLTSLLKGAAG